MRINTFRATAACRTSHFRAADMQTNLVKLAYRIIDFRSAVFSADVLIIKSARLDDRKSHAGHKRTSGSQINAKIVPSCERLSHFSLDP